MEKYSVRFKKSVTEDLRSIPRGDVQRILQRIDALALDPRGEGCIKLSGRNHCRVRQGVYRIIYEIRDAELVITVIKVGHRSAVYR